MTSWSNSSATPLVSRSATTLAPLTSVSGNSIHRRAESSSAATSDARSCARICAATSWNDRLVGEDVQQIAIREKTLRLRHDRWNSLARYSRKKDSQYMPSTHPMRDLRARL